MLCLFFVTNSNQALVRNSMTSASCTTYSLPSTRSLPASFAAFSPPADTKSS